METPIAWSKSTELESHGKPLASTKHPPRLLFGIYRKALRNISKSFQNAVEKPPQNAVFVLGHASIHSLSKRNKTSWSWLNFLVQRPCLKSFAVDSSSTYSQTPLINLLRKEHLVRTEWFLYFLFETDSRKTKRQSSSQLIAPF